MSELKGTAVLISGASSGIGAEMARQLVSRGARVGLLARRGDRLRELARELGGSEHVAWTTADVCDGPGLSKALDGLESTLGQIDVVVANAGYAEPEPPNSFKPGTALAMYDTNLFGMLRLIDWALPKFLERGAGQIVGISSMASYLGMPYSASYSGSKAAMRVHLQSLRITLAPYGIAVTTICPGFVKSALTEAAEFPTPFIYETERAVKLMVDAMERRKGEVVFPWQMRGMIGMLSRLLPTVLAEKLLSFDAPPKRPLQTTDSES